jgi:antirestriction protein
MSELRIYVACLAAYNNGILYGRWVDATQDAEDIRDEITAMLAASPIPGAEEYAIHDYDGFGPLNLGEYESIDRIAEIAQGIEEHGEAFSAYLSNDPTADTFDDDYAGTWDSEEEYAQDFVDSVGGWAGAEIPAELEPYLDWDMITRDLMMDHWSVKSSDYRVHIFRSY